MFTEIIIYKYISQIYEDKFSQLQLIKMKTIGLRHFWYTITLCLAVDQWCNSNLFK